LSDPTLLARAAGRRLPVDGGNERVDLPFGNGESKSPEVGIEPDAIAGGKLFQCRTERPFGQGVERW
jgi:hypothetical protein